MPDSNFNDESDGGEKLRWRSSLSLKARAVRYLARREYSRLELRQRLHSYLSEAETEDDLDSILDDLEQKGYLSDDRFARSKVRSRSARYGNARIAYELKTSGVSTEVIEQALSEVAESEANRARQLWLKRFGRSPQDFKERSQQMRYLLSRGFSMEVARKVINADDFDDF